jgi:hypothetical protein
MQHRFSIPIYGALQKSPHNTTWAMDHEWHPAVPGVVLESRQKSTDGVLHSPERWRSAAYAVAPRGARPNLVLARRSVGGARHARHRARPSRFTPLKQAFGAHGRAWRARREGGPPCGRHKRPVSCAPHKRELLVDVLAGVIARPSTHQLCELGQQIDLTRKWRHQNPVGIEYARGQGNRRDGHQHQ